MVTCLVIAGEKAIMMISLLASRIPLITFNIIPSLAQMNVNIVLREEQAVTFTVAGAAR